MTTVTTMINRQRYDKVFIEALNLQQEDLNEALIYNSVPSWDSVGHMTMMAALETEFDIRMETEDIIDFSSNQKGTEILAKYEIHC